MKLSFSRKNSLCGFLTVTTVAALMLSYLVGSLAKTTQELSQIAVVPSVQLESLFGGASEENIQEGHTSILNLYRKGDVLASHSEPPPSPPVPEGSGGGL
jgi:hypothetical protein